MGLLLLLFACLLIGAVVVRVTTGRRHAMDSTPRQTRAMWLVFGSCVVLPILAMINCEGWNEGSGTCTACFIDIPFLRGVAESLYGWLLLSAFTLGLPIFAYLFLVLVLARFVGRRFF
jgi:hypothetical protein